MSLRTPLSRVRGLGSAKEGTSHWWAQRVTAIALVPLTLWFIAFIIPIIGADYAAARLWISHPVNALLLVLLLITTFYHALLGLQVIIEDYVHAEWLKVTSLLAMKFILIVLGASALFAVLRIALGD
jgi:succinate dehydrogenase / fumarate reductase membrane anchor subunit